MVKTALLNKLRSSLEGLLRRIAWIISKTRVTPNQLTLSTILLALAGYVLTIQYKTPFILLASILTTGFLDAIDGSLARLTNTASRRGAFLDSFTDRICEIIYSLTLIELGFNTKLVLLYLAFSLMVSYTRARGESLGVNMSGVGLMERAERLIGLSIILLLYAYIPDIALLLFIVLTILTGITVLERFLYAWRVLSSQSADRS